MHINIQARTEMNGSAQQGGRNPSTADKTKRLNTETSTLLKRTNWRPATGENAHDNVHLCPLDGRLKAGVGANNTDPEVAVGANQG